MLSVVVDGVGMSRMVVNGDKPSAFINSLLDSVLLSMFSNEVIVMGCMFIVVLLGYELLLLLLLPKLLPMLAMLTLLNRSDRLVKNSNVELDNVG